MSQNRLQVDRRTFVKGAAVSAAAVAAPMIVPSSVFGQDAPSNNIHIGFIGVGSRGNAHVNGLSGRRGVQAVAACDVDEKYLARAKKNIEDRNKRTGRGGDCATFHKYEELIARDDIDAVVITTPDHWHTKIAVEAMQAGKDVYCEKPLTLTIDEGKILSQVTRDTGRVFQVGTQQRSGRQFLNTVAFIRDGGLGKISKVSCSIGGAPQGGPFPVQDPPPHLDWDRWLGQAPLVPYREKRCHYQFRWWYEYSGGKMTDWGAHHVDIAQWGIGMEGSGPHTVEPVSAEHPVPFKDGMPTVDDSYNTATAFLVKAHFAGDIEMHIRNDGGNGITFTGEKGEIFVSRNGRTGKLNGETPKVDQEKLAAAYKTDMPLNHYENWLHCIRNRSVPVSDVWSHHRILTTCHLANIAIRLGKTLKWDPKQEMIQGDAQANMWLKRPQRKGYEIIVKQNA